MALTKVPNIKAEITPAPTDKQMAPPITVHQRFKNDLLAPFTLASDLLFTLLIPTNSPSYVIYYINMVARHCMTLRHHRFYRNAFLICGTTRMENFRRLHQSR